MNTVYKLWSVILFLAVTLTGNAQDNRTLDTKVADILAQMPTEDLEHSNRLMQEMITLGENGILKFTDMLVPLGTGDDTAARFALQTVAVYSGGSQPTIPEGLVEKAFLEALAKVSDNEVKTFLLERMQFCATNASIGALKKYLSQEKLYKPAVAALRAIGTPEAGTAILATLKNADMNQQAAFVDNLGALRFTPAVAELTTMTASPSILLKQKALMALANIADPASYGILYNAVAHSNYVLDDTKSVLAFIHFGKRLQEEGNIAVSDQVANALLKNCKAANQLHFRSVGVDLSRTNHGNSAIKLLLKEAQSNDKQFVGAVLDAASEGMTASEVSQWAKVYKKLDASMKPLLIRTLSKRKEAVVFGKVLTSALKDKDTTVRIAAIKALAFQEKANSFSVLIAQLGEATSPDELAAIEGVLLRICDVKDNPKLAAELNNTNAGGKEVIIHVLAARRAKDQMGTLLGLLDGQNENVKAAVYQALASLASKEDFSKLIQLMNATDNEAYVLNLQKALVKVVDDNEGVFSDEIYKAYTATNGSRPKMLPLLAALSSDKALQLVAEQLESNSSTDRMMALDALTHWKNANAIPYLFRAATSKTADEFQNSAVKRYLDKVVASNQTDDQKLLLVRKLMPEVKTTEQKEEILSAAQGIKTFLSLVFVADYLKDAALMIPASNAAIAIALPTPGVKNGLSGEVVRAIVSRSVDNLTGPDSQYIKIDVKEFLDKMPDEKGFVSIFNGKDLSGWEGLVKDPIARSKMSARQLAKEQAKANEQMKKDWYVKDGVIGFRGDGYDNICTIKDYGDFEMLVDWKITKGGDSGIYVRGTPQVQIWDTALIHVGAQVGSGGLYNNQKNESKPLTVADNPIDEWNTFRIKMVGDRVTVYLNGVLVTDNVILENYWDRTLPIFSKEAIELQAHGEDLGFRNVYVREIPSGDDFLTKEEQKEGFTSLFNGKDLEHWRGNKTDYIVENNELLVRPKEGGHGNLYTIGEYADFVFRFDFKLTPGANNGLGIHTPLEGDAAYVGKELQILDNTAAIYANLEAYQYHGSVYGVIAAKKGALNPVGEWNSEEVIVNGDQIKITLNGKVIVEGDMKEASKKGTADHKEHPGLQRHKGHIAFLGHGSELAFKNIRIKDTSTN